MPTQELRNSLKTNHRLHWYLIDKVLGQGGFGITYLAHDPNLDQFVAVKEYLPMELAVRDGDNSVYPASEANGERYKWGLERFISEARTLAKFKHPAIVRVLSVFEENNTAYMVMEYERGNSLQEVIDQRKQLPEQELIRIVEPLLDGLDLIHSNGFIHRDIKPANIYIRRDGSPVLLDFGSARQALGEQTKSLTSIVSPGYAPFEQYYSKSDRQGPWTDIYSMAATMYRAITGLMPMDAIDRSEAILKSEKDAFISAETIGQGKYSPQFLRAIDNGLQFSEKKRPQTIDEWRTQLGMSADAGSYSQRATELFADVEPSSKTNFEAPSTPPQAPSERHIETQIATRPRGESLEPTELPSVANSIGNVNVSMPPNSQMPAQHSSSWGKIILAGVLSALVVGVLALGFSGPEDFVGNLKRLVAGAGDVEAVQTLVAKGDRSLAAGKVYQPFDGSALDYYRQAVQIDRDNVAARQGIELTAPEVQRALNKALDEGDLKTAESLYDYLDSLPYKPFELTDASQAIKDKRAESAAAAREQQRIKDFLVAADDDMQAGRLVSPAQGNALLKFRAVLLLDPENDAAAAGIEAIAAQLAADFNNQLQENKFTEAETTLADLSALEQEKLDVAELEKRLQEKQQDLAQQQSKAASISELLTAADKDLAAVRLASPRNRNAYDRYKKVLELDPDNEQAKAGIRAVADKYAELANTALSNREADKL
ncbi:MAG: serine/threonine-protein kinase, partial [Pseudomonadota bacterium]